MILQKIFTKGSQENGGFVILFTILISLIIFTMGIGIYSIALRQTILSTTAREAGQAFYSADAGVECALSFEYLGYLDNTQGGQTQMYSCGTDNVNLDILPDRIFFIVGIGEEKLLRAPCAAVSIFTEGSQRRIVSQGFNNCFRLSASDEFIPDRRNPRLVERNLDVFYEIQN